MNPWQFLFQKFLPVLFGLWFLIVLVGSLPAAIEIASVGIGQAIQIVGELLVSVIGGIFIIVLLILTVQFLISCTKDNNKVSINKSHTPPSPEEHYNIYLNIKNRHNE